MQQRGWRLGATIAAIILAVAGFSYYFATHPGVGRQLEHLSPLTLLSLFGLYGLWFLALAAVTIATLRLCQVSLRPGESLLLTAYSSIINFFGPLQSGPAFRALYLKQKHDLQLKRYAAATAMYYLFFAVFSGLLLLSGWLGWILLPVIAALSMMAAAASRLPPVRRQLRSLDLAGWYWLALATLAQVGMYVAIYFVELHSVLPTVTISQALVYTGAANFALFVSLTPGAVGFRESFLLFSQRLHHIGNTTIVSANIIDRSVYVVLLLLLTIAIFGSHARRRLRVA